MSVLQKALQTCDVNRQKRSCSVVSQALSLNCFACPGLKKSVLIGTPVTRNDRIALSHFDEAIDEPVNLAAESCFFEDRSGIVYSEARI